MTLVGSKRMGDRRRKVLPRTVRERSLMFPSALLVRAGAKIMPDHAESYRLSGKLGITGFDSSCLGKVYALVEGTCVITQFQWVDSSLWRMLTEERRGKSQLLLQPSSVTSSKAHLSRTRWKARKTVEAPSAEPSVERKARSRRAGGKSETPKCQSKKKKKKR